jgi:uncharacterized iron-regulated membrane protein
MTTISTNPQPHSAAHGARADSARRARFFHQPQRVWLRRALFQLHLWTGLGLGLYVMMLSLTGSVLVYRTELYRFFAAASTRDTTDGQRFVLWLVRLHDELLLGRSHGLWWNGAFSLIFTLSVLAGAVVWWPGVSRWRRSLVVNFRAGWRRINWDIHSALGFWLFAFMLIWGISGWYMGIPDPLTNLFEHLASPNAIEGERFGDILLEWLPRLHFGRWRNPVWGPWLKALWAIVGIAPAALFVTGSIMWWNRVVRRRRNGSPDAASPTTMRA